MTTLTQVDGIFSRKACLPFRVKEVVFSSVHRSQFQHPESSRSSSSSSNRASAVQCSALQGTLEYGTPVLRSVVSEEKCRPYRMCTLPPPPFAFLSIIHKSIIHKPHSFSTSFQQHILISLLRDAPCLCV